MIDWRMIFVIVFVGGVLVGTVRILVSGQTARVLSRMGAATIGVFIGLSVVWSTACAILYALGHESRFVFGELFVAGVSGFIGMLFLYWVGFSAGEASSGPRAMFWKRSVLRLLLGGILMGLVCGLVAGMIVTSLLVFGESIGNFADKFR